MHRSIRLLGFTTVRRPRGSRKQQMSVCLTFCSVNNSFVREMTFYTKNNNGLKFTRIKNGITLADGINTRKGFDRGRIIFG